MRYGPFGKNEAETLDNKRKMYPGKTFLSISYEEIIEDGFVPDYSKMNMLNPVYVPKGLSRSDLYDFQKQMVKAFYFRIHVIV